MKSFYTAIKPCFLASCILWAGCSEPTVNAPVQDEEERPEPKKEKTHTPVASTTTEEKSDEAKDSAKEEVSEKETAAIAAKEAAEYEARRKTQVAKFAKIRAGVVGKKFESLTLSERTFTGVTVSEINDQEIRLTHSGGIASIPWEEVDQKVKDLWGFDAEAIEHAKRQQELAIAKREEIQNSPEQIKFQREKEQMLKSEKSKQLKQDKEAIARRMRDLNAEIARGKTAIAKLKSSQVAMEKAFKKEDADAKRIRDSRNDSSVTRETIGGIKTSKADRERPLQLIKTQIITAGSALKKLELELQAEQKKLRALEAS